MKWLFLLLVGLPLAYFVLRAIFWEPFVRHEELERENERLREEIKRLSSTHNKP